LENIKKYSEAIADELLDNVHRANFNDKKSQSRAPKKLRIYNK
jgi:hypothetical protein